MVKKIVNHKMTVLYPNLCYIKVCYKGIDCTLLCYKTWVFFLNNSNNLDLSLKADLNYLELFFQRKLSLIADLKKKRLISRLQVIFEGENPDFIS